MHGAPPLASPPSLLPSWCHRAHGAVAAVRSFWSLPPLPFHIITAPPFCKKKLLLQGIKLGNALQQQGIDASMRWRNALDVLSALQGIKLGVSSRGWASLHRCQPTNPHSQPS